MKIGVIGSNDLKNKKLFFWALDTIIAKGNFKNIEIYTLNIPHPDSNFIGASSFACDYANFYHIPFTSIKTEKFNLSHPKSIIKQDSKGNKFVENAIEIRDERLLSQIRHIIIFHREEEEFLQILSKCINLDINIFEFNLNELNIS